MGGYATTWNATGGLPISGFKYANAFYPYQRLREPKWRSTYITCTPWRIGVEEFRAQSIGPLHKNAYKHFIILINGPADMIYELCKI
jgi:hypothetical protein